VGLDPQVTRRAALANPHHRETLRFGGQKIVSFLDSNGLLGGPSMHLWRRSCLLG
jgi:hypothetical protein